MTTVAELRKALRHMADDTELYVHVGTSAGHTTVPFSLGGGPESFGPRAALIHCETRTQLTPWGKPCPVMTRLADKEAAEPYEPVEPHKYDVAMLRALMRDGVITKRDLQAALDEVES